MQKLLNLSTDKVKKLIESLDHIDEDTVTWNEFTKWLAKEGSIRNIAND